MANLSLIVITSCCLVFLVIPLCGGNEEAYQRIRKTCHYDSDCIMNAYCKDQSYCQCKKDFIIFVNQTNNFFCLQGAVNVNDPCEQDIQCTKPFGNDARCTSRTCQCVPDAHFRDGLCYKTAKIGEKCSVSSNCYLSSGLPAYCDKSICKCPKNYHSNQDGSDCIKSVYLTDQCDKDEECITQNSRCIIVCRCAIGYVQSSQNYSCLKAADYMGDPCQEDKQCTEFLENAVCGMDKKCKCHPGFHYILPSSQCYKDILLGQMCEKNEECATADSECQENRCKCSQGYQQSHDKASCVTQNKSNSSEYAYIHNIYLLLFLLSILKTLQDLNCAR